MSINTISNNNLPSNPAFTDEYDKPGYPQNLMYEAATNATGPETVTGTSTNANPFTLEDTFTDTSGNVTTTYFNVTPNATTFNYSVPLGPLANGDHTLETSTAQGATTTATFSNGTLSGPYDVLVAHGATITPAVVTNITDAHDTVGTDGNTASTGLTFSGTADSFTIIRVFVGGGANGGGTQIADAVQTDSQGHWTVTENPSFVGALPAGQNFYQVTATDIAGNANAGVTHSFNVDTQAPTLNFTTVNYTDTSVNHVAETKNGVVSLSGTVTDDVHVDSVEVYAVTGTNASATTVDLGAATVTGGANGAAGTWMLNNVTLTGDGQKSFYAVATDEAGNFSQANGPTSFLLDQTAPITTTPNVAYTETGLINPPADHITNVNSVTLTNIPNDLGGASASGVYSVQVFDSLNGGASTLVGNATFDPQHGGYAFTDGGLADGTHSLTEVVTDVAGNQSAPTTPFVVTVDTVAPVLGSQSETYTTTVGSHAAGSSVSGLTNDPNVTVTVSTTDTGGTGVNSVAIYDDQGTGTAPGTGADVFVGTATLQTNGSYVLTTSALGQGVHTLFADVEDNASNVTLTPHLASFTLDTIAPTAPTLNIVDTGSQQPSNPVTNNDALSGVAEANSAVSLVIDGVTAVTTTAGANGAYSFTPAGLSQGSHTVSVTATDAAGNTSAATTGSLVYDTISPTVTVAESTPGQHVTATSSTVPITITLSDPSLNADGSAHTITATDFTVVGGTIGGITQSSSNPLVYTATFTNTATGNNVSDSVTFNAGVIFDQAGNANAAGSTAVTGDTQPPAAPVITDVDGSPVGSRETGVQQVIVSGTSEANSVVQVYDVVQNDNADYAGSSNSFFFGVSRPGGSTLIGTTTTDANGHFSLTASNLTSDVTHVMTAVATDAVGNQSATSNAVAAAVLSGADTYNAKDVIPSSSGSNLSSPITNYFVVGSAGESLFTTNPLSGSDIINAGRTPVEVINAEYTVNSTITVGASAFSYVQGGQGASIMAGSGMEDFVIDLLKPGSALVGSQGNPILVSSASASPLSNAQSIHQFTAQDTLDVSQVYGVGSSLEVDTTSTGQIVIVHNDLAGGTTEVKIDGAPINASQIITEETSVYDSTDAGQIVSTYYGGSSTASTVAGYGASGAHLFTNFYNGSGQLVEQDGFAPDGHEAFVNTYDPTSGRLLEQQGFNSAGQETIAIFTASDGSKVEYDYSSNVLVSLEGFAADGHETFVNTYDHTSGRLLEQDGFNSAGQETIAILTAADGSKVEYDYSNNILVNQEGFAADGHETFVNTYDHTSGRLLEQDGFNTGGVKTIEIDHYINGGSATSMFDSSGSLTSENVYDANQNVLSMLTRTPSTGAYTNTAEVGGITLSTITGQGELVLNGPTPITIGLTSGFGTAAVDGFVTTSQANGGSHDLVHVLTTQAGNYGQLLTDAHDSGADVVITFDANDVLTLHGLHTAQLSSSDFLFG